MKRTHRNKVNIQKKLLVIFFAVFIVPLIVFGFFSYANFERILQSNAFDYNMEKLGAIQANVTSFFDDLEVQVRGIEADYVFNTQLGKQEADYEKTVDYINNNEYIYNKLSNIIIQNKKLVSLYLYTDSGMSYCVNFEDAIDTLYTPEGEDWFRSIMDGEAGSTVLSTRIDKQTAAKTSAVVPYVCPIHTTAEPDASIVKGIVQFNIDDDAIGGSFETSEVKGTSYLIVSTEGYILHSDRKYFGNFEQRMLELMQGGSGREVYKSVDGDTLLVGYRRIGSLGWYAVSLTDNARLMADTRSYKTSLILFTLAISVILILLSIAISTGISRPVRSMEKIITEIERGDTQTMYDIKMEPRSGLMKEHYSHFVHTINKLIRELNENMEKRRAQEILILQSQINPHFIYNTLNTIKWLAKMEKNVRIEEAVAALINLLRSAIRVGQDFISVDEEIRQIEQYIKIQKLRYDETFEVTMDIGDNVRVCKTLKFMLQPVVENAIFHGVDLESHRGHIHISIQRTGDTIEYTVTDNGAGMDSDKAARLLSGVNKHKGMTGIGIRNVSERIKSNFGTGYGMKIDSRKGMGTTVHIVIPAIPYENGDGHESIDR